MIYRQNLFRNQTHTHASHIEILPYPTDFLHVRNLNFHLVMLRDHLHVQMAQHTVHMLRDHLHAEMALHLAL